MRAAGGAGGRGDAAGAEGPASEGRADACADSAPGEAIPLRFGATMNVGIGMGRGEVRWHAGKRPSRTVDPSARRRTGSAEMAAVTPVYSPPEREARHLQMALGRMAHGPMALDAGG